MAKAIDQATVMNSIKKRAKGAWNRARSTEAKPRGGGLPAGISNGIAQLSSWKLSTDKNGDPYFSITGIVKEPAEYAGLRATTQYFIKETANKTVEEKLTEFSNDMQLLGGKTEGTSIDDLPSILDELCKQKPHFKFQTWQGRATPQYPNPSVNTTILGLATDYEFQDTPADDTTEDPEAEPDTDTDGGDGGDATDPVDSADDWQPQKGEIYAYKSSPTAEPKEFEVTGVNVSSQHVSLKRCEDGKVFKNVGWDRLETAE